MPTVPKTIAPRRRAFIILCAVVSVWMLLLNCLTPYIADDFTFAYAFDTGLRLHSLPQLLQSLAYHYYEWSGRVVVKFFAQGFTMFPKLIFNLCNTAAYIGLALVIYRLARGRRSGRYDVTALLLIFAALWEISPVFGQTNLWMCGACNYLWSTLGCLAFLLPWRYWLQKPFDADWKMALGMGVAGIFAGWAMENTSAGLLACLVLCLGCALVFRKRNKVPLWMWTGFGGAVVGFIILISARGNYNRAGFITDSRPMMTRLAVRFFNCLNILKDYALPLLFTFAVLYLLLWLRTNDAESKNAKSDEAKRKRFIILAWPAVLFLGGLAANFAMMASPEYDTRVSHGPLTLLTAACIACLVQLDGYDCKALRKGFACVAACAVVLCAFHACEAGYDIASFYMMDRTRDAAIRAEVAATSPTDAESYGIEPYTRWCAAYGLPDISENSEDSIGLCRARWYNLAALTATESRTYPFPGHTNAAYEAGLAAAEQAVITQQ